ncbi:MAG: 50S ribosomal protein L1 [bacterium]|nr:50S ribosomal protein L1 [bacterium]
MKRSKRFREIESKVEKGRLYEVSSAIKLLKELSTAKFDEAVDISVKLEIDPKKDHVRGMVSLPYGTGKTRRILVLAEGEKIEEAKKAGADFAGGDEFLNRIQEGWLDFDIVIATPELMPKISKFGKLLGPRGLMPNPKTGTVTQEVGKAVRELKGGKIEFKMDKTGCVHGVVGRASFDADKLRENVIQFLKELWNAKPAGAKGTYFKSIYLSSTMSPSIKIDPKFVSEVMK